jgi:hypothetical protein
MRPPITTNEDEQHLKLLSIFHFVVGGLIALVSCIPIFHFMIGLMFLVAPPPSRARAGQGPQPETFIGGMFVVIAGSIILAGWTVAACVWLAGWFLYQRKHPMFCLVAACLECMWMPFGTVLGVFTIIVLQRPSVKKLFEGAIPEPAREELSHHVQAL